MKRKLLCVGLVLMLVLMAAMPVVADQREEEPVRATLAIGCGITHLYGNHYVVFGNLASSIISDLTVSVLLYDSAGNRLATSTNTEYDDFTVITTRAVTLSSGTYTVKSYGESSSGDTAQLTRIITI